jgi:glycosyltransferase involved in cell wall biosynthesis
MRIGMVGHIYPVPPLLYGGVERAVSWWVDELKNQGHKVVLFANKNSKVNVDKLVPCERGGMDRFVNELLANSNDYDIIHDNNDTTEPSSLRWKNPYIYSVHATVWISQPNPVFISHNQCRFFNKPDGVVNHYGFPLEKFSIGHDKEDFILWCGSLRGVKAPEMAVQLAEDTGHKLYIIGPIQEAKYLNFQSYKTGRIIYLGEMGEERMEYFKRASAFLYTCHENWMEGFGLVNVEALLSGTPVIGLCTEKNQIVLEHYTDGVGGFVCKSYEDMRKVLNNKEYLSISPEACRVEGEKFNVVNTVSRYLNLYESVLKGNKW